MRPQVDLHAQRGFSSVMLIAMVVLLAALTTYTLNFSGMVQSSQTQDLAVSRVDQAARTGIEWQRYQLVKAAQPGGCAALANLNVPFNSGTVVVTIRCQRTPSAAVTHSEAGVSLYTYSYTATACSPVAGGATCPLADAVKPSLYVERAYSGMAACTGVAPTPCTW